MIVLDLLFFLFCYVLIKVYFFERELCVIWVKFNGFFNIIDVIKVMFLWFICLVREDGLIVDLVGSCKIKLRYCVIVGKIKVWLYLMLKNDGLGV